MERINVCESCAEITYQWIRLGPLCHYAMVVCRLHDTAGSLAHGVFISRPTGNPDPLVKSRPTGWDTK